MNIIDLLPAFQAVYPDTLSVQTYFGIGREDRYKENNPGRIHSRIIKNRRFKPDYTSFDVYVIENRVKAPSWACLAALVFQNDQNYEWTIKLRLFFEGSYWTVFVYRVAGNIIFDIYIETELLPELITYIWQSDHELLYVDQFIVKNIPVS